jgi:uncharacterized membrane protein
MAYTIRYMNIMLIEYVVALIASLILDGLWLGVISKSWYDKFIGSLMLEHPHAVPGIFFYIIYAAATMVFIINPAVREEWSTLSIAAHGALLGLVIYGAYDLTNLSILKGWSVPITVIDIAWGMVFTTLVSLITVFVVNLVK